MKGYFELPESCSRCGNDFVNHKLKAVRLMVKDKKVKMTCSDCYESEKEKYEGMSSFKTSDEENLYLGIL